MSLLPMAFEAWQRALRALDNLELLLLVRDPSMSEGSLRREIAMAEEAVRSLYEEFLRELLRANRDMRTLFAVCSSHWFGGLLAGEERDLVHTGSFLWDMTMVKEPCLLLFDEGRVGRLPVAGESPILFPVRFVKKIETFNHLVPVVELMR